MIPCGFCIIVFKLAEEKVVQSSTIRMVEWLCFFPPFRMFAFDDENGGTPAPSTPDTPATDAPATDAPAAPEAPAA